MSWISSLFAGNQISLRLRTKFLLSLVLITAGLTCATLLFVRSTAKAQVQRQVEEDARNAMLTFQVMQHQRQLVLSRKADLLATLAFMRNGDAETIEDVSQDPWQSEDCDLFVLADSRGKIVALHTKRPEFPVSAAEEMFRRSFRRDGAEAWWVSGRRVYQVVLQPYYQDPPLNSILLGTVAVGRQIDTGRASDLARISSSEMVFRSGDDIVLSTFPALREHDLIQQILGQTMPEQVQLGNERFFASTVELNPGLKPALSLTVLKSYEGAMAFLERLNHVLLGLGLVAVVAGGALVFLISDTFTRPLASLVEGVRALEQGNFKYPLEAHGGDEVARVTRAFENMRSTLQNNEAQKEQLEDQLRQSQKMDALGRLAGGVAHDFNNLLTVIKGNSDLLLERFTPGDPGYGNCHQIQKVSDRAASLTRQLLAFSRRQVLQPRVLDLNVHIAEMGSLLRRLVREDVEFLLRLGESLGRVKADPGQIEQVLLNLTVNACDAMPQGGRLTIETNNAVIEGEYAGTYPPIEPGHYVVLAVTDTGLGMDADTKARIFEPFFTTKDPGKGTGLGLATVYGVVKQSGGFIRVESAPGNGARFEIYLPHVDEHVELTSTEKFVAPAQGLGTVLLAEDEEEVRALACEFLKSAGYRVLTAQDGADALEIAGRLGKAIHVLVTDIVMPKMRGTELAERLKDLIPNLKIVYMSGYLDQSEESAEFLEKAFFLQKPFSRDMLLRKVGDALRSKSSIQPATQGLVN
jgi:signal transduction histidine kinase/ActR/RegA family two-component response regulator